MLFTQYIQERRYDEQARIEAEIGRLQQLLTDIQAATQTDLALEQMADSALDQLAIAVNNIMRQNPELKPYMREAAIRILDSDLPVGLLSSANSETQQPTRQPKSPTSGGASFVDSTIDTSTATIDLGEDENEGSDTDNSEDSDESDDDTDPDNDPPTPPNGGGSGGSNADMTIDVQAEVLESGSDSENAIDSAASSLTNTPVVPSSNIRNSERAKGARKTLALPAAPNDLNLVITQTGDDDDRLEASEIKLFPQVLIEGLAKEFGIKIHYTVSSTTQVANKTYKALYASGLTWGITKQIASELSLPVSFVKSSANNDSTETSESIAPPVHLTQNGYDFDILSEEQIRKLPEKVILCLANELEVPTQNRSVTGRLPKALATEGITWACLKQVIKNKNFRVVITNNENIKAA